ncbi:hypothetical protein PLESTM_000679800 [Pleodorina starrii]|nr:hypothetical protein PLESTM_000679800 [Pleodorina starrii]
MADSGGDLVAEFISITGSDDGTAIQMLEAANFNLEEAVQLFFAAEGHVGGGASSTGAAAGGGSAAAGGAGRQRSGAGPVGGHLDDDGVRAPLPTKVERLYGDDFDPRAMYQYHGLSGRPPPAQVDVFRDFRAETAAAAAAAAAAGSQAPSAAAAGSGALAGTAGGGTTQGLSDLFKLPADLVFSGNAQLAKARAATEGKWLLLNVQSATEFASHRLNRDTWSHEALKEVLKGTFVFYQTHENSPDGRELIKAYRLDSLAASTGGSVCPAILVVDPLTGAQMWHRSGFIDAEKLMEELVPFMDHGPLDAGASNLAQTNMKRKAAGTAAAAAAAAAAGAGSGGAAGGRTGAPLTEDEELALAIAMSMERGGEGGADAAGASPMDQGGDEEGGDAGLEDLDEAAIWEQIQAAERAQGAKAEASGQKGKSPEELAAEALARVPAEPPEGDPEAVRVALRMPDGTRVTRRFRSSEPVRVLFDFGVAHVPEAAAGRSLVISHAMPGGQALTDPEQSLGAAGVAGAMLAIKLAD